ncbi:unnamed protein product, partial [Rotaria sp. Silwood2]
LHLLYDPQDFSERLFRQLETSKERFEVKLLHQDLLSRLIGLHQLLLLNFYPSIHNVTLNICDSSQLFSYLYTL